MTEQLIKKKNSDVRDPRSLGIKFANNPLIRNPRLNVRRAKPKVKVKFDIQVLFERKQNKCQSLLGLNYLNLLIFIDNLFIFITQNMPNFCSMAIKCPFLLIDGQTALSSICLIRSPQFLFDIFQNSSQDGPSLTMKDKVRHVIVGSWVPVNDDQFCSISLCDQRHGGSGLDNQ